MQQKAAGGASAVRYGHCTARQGAQLQEDAADRRQRQVLRLPRLYRLVAPLPVATTPETAVQAAALQAEAPELQHLGTLRQEGQPPAFALPAVPAALNSSLRYLPCTVEGGEAGAAGTAGGSSAAGGGGRGGGAPRVYSKRAVPLLADDPLLPQLVQQARQPTAAAGTQEGGDGSPPPPPPPPPADATADAAAAASQPQFCLAAPAFAALVSTPMLRRGPAWEIPVTILSAEVAARGLQDGSGGGSSSGGSSSSGGGGTVVCLEKPLLHRIMSVRAKQQRLQKYAVLSAGVQAPAAEAQHAQQQQQQAQQATPGRRRTRGSAAAAGTGDSQEQGAAAAAVAPAAAGHAVPHREAAYDCWQLGDCRLLVRSHGRLQLQQEAQQQQQQPQPEGGPPPEEQQEQQEQQPEPGGQHVVLGLKTEYLPDPDRGKWLLWCGPETQIPECRAAPCDSSMHAMPPHPALLADIFGPVRILLLIVLDKLVVLC